MACPLTPMVPSLCLTPTHFSYCSLIKCYLLREAFSNPSHELGCQLSMFITLSLHITYYVDLNTYLQNYLFSLSPQTESSLRAGKCSFICSPQCVHSLKTQDPASRRLIHMCLMSLTPVPQFPHLQNGVKNSCFISILFFFPVKQVKNNMHI